MPGTALAVAVAPVAGAGGVGGGGGGPGLIYDTFTGTNGTLLPAHTPDNNSPGNSWVQGPGTVTDAWSLSNGKAVIDPLQYQRTAYIDTGITDYRVTATVNVAGVSSSFTRGVVVRGDGAGSNQYWVGLTYSGNVLRIGDVGYGSLAEVAFTVTPGVDYELVVECVGTTITASIGATSVQYTSAATTGRTYVGLCQRDGSDTLDDFLVEAL